MTVPRPDDDALRYAFDHDGATLVVEEQGAGRRVFVLVHGIGMGRTVFAGLVPELIPHGRVIAVDQPGYGEAPEPPRTPTMARTADLVAALLRARARPDADEIVVIGHSMGTQVAVELAARHPMLVDRLVLLAPTVDVAARTAPAQLLRLGRDLFAESPKVLVVGAREYLRAGPNLRRKLKAMLSHRPEDAYPRVQAPTLVVRGEGDVVCPRPWCASVVSRIPDARLAEIPGHGHETMIRDARPTASLVLGFIGAGAPSALPDPADR
ncbi:alpha/beta fold hydrolase [Microbacterium sp. GXF7504]